MAAGGGLVSVAGGVGAPRAGTAQIPAAANISISGALPDRLDRPVVATFILAARISPFRDRYILPLHVRVIRPAAAFWYYPTDILFRVFHVACLAVDTVLRVDLQPLAAARIVDDFIDASRTIALFGRVVEAVID